MPDIEEQQLQADATNAEPQGYGRTRRHLGNISSSMAGESRAGNIAADRRMNLLHAQGEPQLGRRTNDPEPEPPWYRRREFFLGTFLGLVVVIGVMVLLMLLAGGMQLG